jgi:hypothetical protein
MNENYVYPVRRCAAPPALDGRLESPAWDVAELSPRFVDMATGTPGLLDTRVGLMYDDHALYAGFWVEEPYPNAKLTERDAIIFSENDVEIFVDGGDSYYEFEINALNTVYEVFFIWKDAYKRGSRFDVPEFDVHGPRACTFGGNFDRSEAHFWTGSHPRGLRWAFLDWDYPGLKTAVYIDGALNNPDVISHGWRVEVALPWSGMTHLAGGRSIPPKPGDEWRLFLGRFQKIALGSGEVQAAWCLTPHGTYDTHMPEKWTTVRFE